MLSNRKTHGPRFIFLAIALFVAAVFLVASPANADQQTLEQTLTQAYLTNHGLKAERAKLRSADEQVSTAVSGYRPSVDAVGEVGHTKGFVAGRGYYAGNSDINPRSVGVNVTQNLFNGLKTYSGVASAKSSVQAQRAALQDAEQKLFVEAAKAHLDVVQATAVLSLNKENERVLQRQLDITKDRFRVGELKKTDVSQAQSRLQSAMVSRLQAEADLANTRSTYTRITGDTPGTLGQPKLEPFLAENPAEIVGIATKKNPSVIAAEYTHDASESDIDVARAELMPKLDLVGSTSRAWDQSTTIQDRQDSMSGMVRLTIPIYHQGADYSRTRAAQQTSTQRRMELEYARQKAREEAINAWQSLQTAHASIVGRREVVSSTADALEGVREESKFGARTTLDVLNAEQELLEAKIGYAKAQHDEALASFQLKAAMGDLTAAALHLNVPLYDPEKNYNDVKGAWVGFADTDEQ